MDDFGMDGGLGMAAPEKPGQGMVRVVGYRWVASRGKDDCPQCAALHGKVFYYDPEPGQASVEEMPKGQLHPNCDCTKIPILVPNIPGFTFETHHPAIKAYMQGKVVRISPPGMLLRLNSSGLAPIYGKN